MVNPQFRIIRSLTSLRIMRSSASLTEIRSKLVEDHMILNQFDGEKKQPSLGSNDPKLGFNHYYYGPLRRSILDLWIIDIIDQRIIDRRGYLLTYGSLLYYLYIYIYYFYIIYHNTQCTSIINPHPIYTNKSLSVYNYMFLIIFLKQMKQII